MRYNQFEGKEISEIGMGCYALSGVYGPVDRSAYKKVLEHAAELGINFFDTADTYGPKAEEVLGEVVAPIRDEVVLQTKVGIKEGTADLSYDAVISACDNSLKRLDTDYIDYYLIHFADPDIPVKETIGALKDLKQDGKIDGYGVGHIGFEGLKEYSRYGSPSVAMMELNAVSRKPIDDLLPFCDENKIGAIAFSVTGRGILTGKFRRERDPKLPGIKGIDPLFQHARYGSALRVVDKMKELGEKYDKTPVQTAIRWVLSRGVLCALTGPSSKEHIEENVGGSGWDIYEEDLEDLDEFLQEEEERLNKEEPAVIERLLRSPLSDDLQRAYSDLVYVIETSVDHSLAKEDEIMPTFQRLWRMRSSEKGLKREKLEMVQKELSRIIL